MNLYKYREIGDLETNELNEFLQKLISNGDLFFSDPADFNDPFDCSFAFSFSGDKEELVSYLRKIQVSEFNIRKILSEKSVDEIIEMILNGFKTAHIIRVYCLSEEFDNTLMWSHYGQNHYGVCIGFKTYIHDNTPHLNISNNQYIPYVENYPPNIFPVNKVIYSDERPEPLDLICNGKKGINESYLTKSKIWEYEKEVRMVIPQSALYKNPIHIKRSEIAEIIFGLRTPSELQEKVIYLLKDKTSIKYYKMHMQDGTYKLIKEEIHA